MDFITNSEPFLQTMWYIALPVSLIFIIQAILTFVGVDNHDGDISLDSPMDVFTFKNLINFLLGFSWTAIAFYNTIESKTLLLVLSSVIGIGFVLMFFFIISQFMKLEEDNTFTLYETIGLTASVYLKIPSYKSGKGKIQISTRGSMRELDAMTEGEEIPTGSNVKIVKTETDSTVIVEKV